MLAGVIAATVPAGAQQAWTAPEGQAYAMLPAPEPGTPVTGGVMLCDQQVWTLSLALEPNGVIEGAEGNATLTARGQPFSVPSSLGNSSIDLNIPYEALEPMMAGIRLHIEFAAETRPVRFPLTGSRRAITAVEKGCSPRELPTENRIALLATSPHLELGRQLRANDIRDFVVSTNQLPELRVAMLELEAGRQLLFSQICGSSWYYGVSGCSLVGFARVKAGGVPESDPTMVDLDGWEPVFESEGAHLYTEPARLNDGWPDLIAIPLKPGFPDMLWTWTGQRYSVEGTIQAELRPGD